MRLITYRYAGKVRLGAWIDDDRTVVDLAAASLKNGESDPAFASMLALIEAGPEALERARRLAAEPPAEACSPTLECHLLAPLPRPVQLRDCLSFPDHVRNCRRTAGELAIQFAGDPEAKRSQLEAARYFDVPADYYDFPIYYVCNRMGITGPDDDIHWPAFSGMIDYELEWAAVIGKEGRGISRDRAHDHIFGYTIFNDWSARDEQAKAMGSSANTGPCPGKDFANTLGPCIVTADEIADPYALKMTARVNGELRSSGSTSSMHYRFEDLIAYLTRGHALYPGEVIGSGTVGTGCSLETRQPVHPGDVVELEVEGIGRLRNRVVAPHIPPGGQGGFDASLARALGMAIKR